MLTAIIDTSGYYATITMKGHAGYGTPGNDIVCAGASILFQTLHNLAIGLATTNYTEKENEKVLRIKKQAIGRYNEDELNPDISKYLDFFVEGMTILQDTYPDNVKVIS